MMTFEAKTSEKLLIIYVLLNQRLFDIYIKKT